jgi:hypothetical protein
MKFLIEIELPEEIVYSCTSCGLYLEDFEVEGKFCEICRYGIGKTEGSIFVECGVCGELIEKEDMVEHLQEVCLPHAMSFTNLPVKAF